MTTLLASRSARRLRRSGMIGATFALLALGTMGSGVAQAHDGGDNDGARADGGRTTMPSHRAPRLTNKAALAASTEAIDDWFDEDDTISNLRCTPKTRTKALCRASVTDGDGYRYIVKTSVKSFWNDEDEMDAEAKVTRAIEFPPADDATQTPDPGTQTPAPTTSTPAPAPTNNNQNTVVVVNGGAWGNF